MGFKADNNGLIFSVSIRLIMPASSKFIPSQKFIPFVISSIHVLVIGFDWVADDKYIEEWFEKHAAKQ